MKVEHFEGFHSVFCSVRSRIAKYIPENIIFTRASTIEYWAIMRFRTHLLQNIQNLIDMSKQISVHDPARLSKIGSGTTALEKVG